MVRGSDGCISCESNRLLPEQLQSYAWQWTVSFEQQSFVIRRALGRQCHAIYHMGSTSVVGMDALPVVDILLELNDFSLIDTLELTLQRLGYQSTDSLCPNGQRVYYKHESYCSYCIHTYAQGHPDVLRHMCFRDYLANHAELIKGYSIIKRSLAEQFPTDMNIYQRAKISFIRAIEYRAGVASSGQLMAADVVSIEPYHSSWQALAAAEMDAIQRGVYLPFVALEHLGSTSVDGLMGKPVIDMYIALEGMDAADQWVQPLESLGYRYCADSSKPSHRWFVKGMPPYGIGRTHHVHLMPMDDNFRRRVYFRDRLRQDVQLRQRYSALKQQLAEVYSNDLVAYTNAKSDFIAEVLRCSASKK